MDQLAKGPAGSDASIAATMALHGGGHLSPAAVNLGLSNDYAPNAAGQMTRTPLLRAWAPESLGFMEPLQLVHGAVGSAWDFFRGDRAPISTNYKPPTEFLKEKFAGALMPPYRFAFEMGTGIDVRTGREIGYEGKPLDHLWGDPSPVQKTYAPGFGRISKAEYKLLAEVNPFSRWYSPIARAASKRSRYYTPIGDAVAQQMLGGMYSVNMERVGHATVSKIRHLEAAAKRELRKDVEWRVRHNAFDEADPQFTADVDELISKAARGIEKSFQTVDDEGNTVNVADLFDVIGRNTEAVKGAKK